MDIKRQTNELMDKIFCVLRQERKAHKWTQTELAKEAGVSTAVVCSIENGKHSMNLNTYLAICMALDMPPEKPLVSGQMKKLDKLSQAFNVISECLLMDSTIA